MNKSKAEHFGAFESANPAGLIPVRGVQKFEFEGTKLVIEGFAFFEDMLEEDAHKIEQQILIEKHGKQQSDENVENDEIVYLAPVLPITPDYVIDDFKVDESLFEDANSLENAQRKARKLTNNYSYKVMLDFNTMTNGQPLISGDYELYIRLKQFVNGRWIALDFTVGSIAELESDYVYTTKMHWYGAKKVTTYSFVVNQMRGAETVNLHSEKLSSYNPADLIVHDDVVDHQSRRASRTKKAIFRVAYNIYKLLPIKERRVSFLSDSRDDLTGNFEFIYNEMQRREDKFDTRFYFKRTNSEPKSIFEYLQLAKAIATSRYVVLDDFYPLIYPLNIRQGIDLIQVWHAVGAFKTFGFSRLGMKGGPSIKSRNHRNYSHAIVSSKNVAPNYAEGFGIDQNRILPLGAPRTDLFFNKTMQDDVKTKIYAQLPFLVGKKVVLFAPTFRGNGQQSAYYPFDWIDYQELYENLADKGYVFLFKIHPFVKNTPAIPYEYSDFFFDVSDYREVNELLLVSDLLITDYSSVVFEYSLLKRKTIFYAPDLSDYMSSRNFYVDYLDFIPGPHVVDTKHLVTEILNDSIDEHRLNSFLNYYFDDMDGKASARFVDILEQGFDQENTKTEGTEEFTQDGKWMPKWGK